MTEIEKMIAEGATPQTIYKMAQEAEARLKEAPRKKEIENARTAVLDALDKYFVVLTGRKLQKETRCELNTFLQKEVEETILNMQNKSTFKTTSLFDYWKSLYGD